MGRSTMPEEKRQDFYLYIDEFHSFSTESFASLLSESRKYRLSLVLSHQYTSQVSDDIRDAVFGNVGTVVAFRIGEGDAPLLEREFGGRFVAEQFTQLDNFEVFVKGLRNGTQAEPFTGSTLPPITPTGGRKEKLVRRSREKYATPRGVVEERFRRWLQQ
jgi:DNA helicase HerA-like ATPase